MRVLPLEEGHHMRELVIAGVITDVANPDGFSAYYPSVAEILSAPDPVLKLFANFTLQLCHNLFSALPLRDAVKPQQCRVHGQDHAATSGK